MSATKKYGFRASRLNSLLYHVLVDGYVRRGEVGLSAAETTVRTGTVELWSTGWGTGKTRFAHTVVPASGFPSVHKRCQRSYPAWIAPARKLNSSQAVAVRCRYGNDANPWRHYFPLCMNLLDLDLNGIRGCTTKLKCDLKIELALHGRRSGSERRRKQDIDLIQSWKRSLRSCELHDRIHSTDLTLRVLLNRCATESSPVKTQVNGMAACNVNRHRGALT